MDADGLIAFEADIAEIFNRAEIRAPVHLDGGNEAALIKIFKDIAPLDWVCGSWRMHYKCLLHGVPPDLLKAEILAGRSISLCFPQYRVISSAIVGGILPIALGLAWSIRRSGGSEKVWVFLGDMTARSGIFDECKRYAMAFELPLTFVIEDNGKSVCTDTRAAWGFDPDYNQEWRYVRSFEYDLPWPHSGAGKRVEF